VASLERSELVSHPESARVLPPLPDWLGEGFPAQGSWTYEDYCRIPDDGKRYEVIRGVLHVSPAPGSRHQLVVGELFVLFYRFVDTRRLGKVLLSPIDVLLPGLASPVEPDIVFVRRERLRIIEEKYIHGPPDLVVEVLSPSNSLSDLTGRLEVFAEAGIDECWIVDPEALRIDVHVRHGRVYAIEGSHGTDVTARSKVIPGFEVPVEDICPGAWEGST
jgi:Uma2 family endonuclease